MKLKKETFSYSEALKRLKEGKKVSCKRWGDEGKVYVYLTSTIIHNADKHELKQLVLHDTKRDTYVSFTPSVENQIDDDWYEI